MKKLSFKSAQIAVDKAFGAYDDLYSDGSDAKRLGDGFFADVTAYRFPRMLIFDRTLRCVSHERTSTCVSRDSFDHLMVHVVLSGTVWIETACDSRMMRQGDTVLFDLTKPQRIWTDEARIASLSIARDAVSWADPLPADFHGRILSQAKSSLLSDVVVSLTNRAESMCPEVAAAATSMVGALLAATIEAERGPLKTPVKVHQKIDRALKFIDANLRNPNLSVGAILKETGMSRSVLYRTFEPLGGVVACIQKRRLLGVRRTLSQPRDARSINAIMEDHGFTSASTGNRAFRDVFGLPPGAFRAAVETSRTEHLADAGTATWAGDATPAKRALDRWIVELR